MPNDAISVSIVDPIMGDKGWIFSDAPGAIPDSVLASKFGAIALTKRLVLVPV